MFILTDTASVEYICKTNASNYIKSPEQVDLTREVFGDGIATAEGQTWKVQRRIASHHFTLGNVQQHMRQVFLAQATRLCARVADASTAGRDVDLQDLFSRFTLQCFTQIAFRHDLQLLSPSLPEDEFGKVSWSDCGIGCVRRGNSQGGSHSSCVVLLFCRLSTTPSS